MMRTAAGGTTPFTAAEGKKFGLTVGSAFLVIAAILLWRSRETGASVTAAIGAFLVVGGLIAPLALRPVHRAWMAFAMGLSKITTPVFMGLMYFVVLTPVGLLRRTLGSNPLRHPPVEGSYWKVRSRKKDEEMRQF